MSLPIHVEAYSGYRANERPLSFSLDIAIGENGVTGVHHIDAVEDRWYDPNAEYFRVRTPEPFGSERSKHRRGPENRFTCPGYRQYG